MKKKLLIIMPAFNEEASIGDTLDRIFSSEIAGYADVLVMNDASTDATGDIAGQKGAIVVNHIYNMGYGSGLWVGYKYAVKHGYSYVVQMDADGQHDVSNIPVIYKSLTTKDEDDRYPDIVLGARFMKGGPDYPTSAIKKFAYGLFRGLIRLGTGQRISDPTTGLQGLSKRTFTYYAGYNHFDDKYPDANIIMQMILLGYKVVEIPALMHKRSSGKSMHSGLKPIFYMVRMAYSIIAVWARIKIFHMDMGVSR